MKVKKPNSGMEAGWRWFGRLLAVCGSLLAMPAKAALGYWQPLANSPPGGNGVSLMLLLSDGTVMAAQNGQGGNYGQSGWYKLTPDANGSYINGTWTTLQSMHESREYYASAVLTDGRVFVAGGEYNSDGIDGIPAGATAEIYDPQADVWTPINPPANLLNTILSGTLSPVGAFWDANSELLPNGSVLTAPVQPTGPNMLIYNPATDTWSAAPDSPNPQDELSWVKLPDNSILMVNQDSTSSMRFVPTPDGSSGTFINDAHTQVQLWDKIHEEIGPAFLLPDGRAFFLGGSGHTAYYTPTGTTEPGTWTPGPDIPGGLVCADAPGAMMVNGKILLDAGPGYTNAPITFFEFDYRASTNGAFIPTTSPTPAGSPNEDVSTYPTAMLDLPDGTVLYSHFANDLYVYTPGDPPIAAGKPVISSIQLNDDGSYTLTGSGLNGISQGAAYGDDLQPYSNYPLVRLTNSANGSVIYARTYNWSSTGVQTNGQPATVQFSLPASVADSPGQYALCVVANGNASDPVTFSSPVWVDFSYTSIQGFYFGLYMYPYNTLSEAVANVNSGGTIVINASDQPSSSPETMLTAKPMTIRSVGGTSFIGH